MQPTLRLTNYADEYQKLVYDDYAEWSNVIHATYYKLDYNNTIFDENYVQTYRRTGELSGRKWNKIYMMPITFIQQVLPAMNSSERGVNYAQDIQTSIVIDPSTNITPAVGDILHFNISGDYVYWNIINVERSAALNKVYYRCSVEQFRPFSDWESYNISGEYIYIEYLKSILPYAQGNNFLILLSRLEHIINYLNSMFHPNICAHLNSNKESYPEIDFILNTYMTIVPPNVTLISEKYIDHIVDDSVLNLLFLPDMFTSDIINFNFVKSNYNPRIKLFLDYKEYITSTSDTYDIDIIKSFYPDKMMEARMCINAFKEAIHNTSLDIPTQDDLKLSLLLKEFLYFLNLTDPVNDIRETSSDIIATNLLEAALEFVIVSRKLYPLSQVSIKFNTEGTDDE